MIAVTVICDIYVCDAARFMIFCKIAHCYPFVYVYNVCSYQLTGICHKVQN